MMAEALLINDLYQPDPETAQPLLSVFIPGDPQPAARPRARVMPHAFKACFRCFSAQEWLKTIGRYVQMYVPVQKAWRDAIGAALHGHIPPEPFDFPIRVDEMFYFRRPQSHYRANGDLRPDAPIWQTSGRTRIHAAHAKNRRSKAGTTSGGDRDNLEKEVLDTLVDLKLLRDDSLVCDGRVRKLYCPPGQAPGLMLELAQLE